MASRVVGLDVGSHAVRAAELTLGRDAPTLERFGQVALPVGAVTDGEVRDPHAVAAALRRLWTDAGFRTKTVIAGIGNQRVIVRQADLPAISEEDLRAALRFEVAELIPIPVDEAVLDFQVLERRVDEDQQEVMRVLLAAAHRDMVRSLLAALEEAGLSASMIDLTPFALMRSLAVPALGLEERPGTAEAIVCIGAGVTNVVVHERGIPRFVRMLVVGGNDVTDAIAGELGVDVDSAESLKRRAGNGQVYDQLEVRARSIVADRMIPLLEEVRGSLDYYLAQSDAAPIGRVMVTGGGSRLPGLEERLARLTGLPVETAHPLIGVRVGRTGIPEQQLADAESLLAVPIGLALAGRSADGGRRISLLPSEVVEVRQQRRNTTLVGAGVGALAMVLTLAWAAQGGKVSKEEARAEKAEQAAAALEADLDGLQGATAIDAQLEQRREMVRTALADDVAWTRLLQEIATVLPNDVWLTGFSGSKAPGAPGGTVNINAKGFDHTSAARWLLRVDTLDGLADVWLPSSTKEGEGARALVNFSSTAELADGARSDRVERYIGGDEPDPQP